MGEPHDGCLAPVGDFHTAARCSTHSKSNEGVFPTAACWVSFPTLVDPVSPQALVGVPKFVALSTCYGCAALRATSAGGEGRRLEGCPNRGHGSVEGAAKQRDRAYSSIGQSPRLITGLFQVRTLVGPLLSLPSTKGPGVQPSQAAGEPRLGGARLAAVWLRSGCTKSSWLGRRIDARHRGKIGLATRASTDWGGGAVSPSQQVEPSGRDHRLKGYWRPAGLPVSAAMFDYFEGEMLCGH